MSFKLLIILIILALGIFLRFYRLDQIPPGLNHDEAINTYNAYSLLKSGKDHYGQSLPLAFRSFGSYSLPIYTYLTTIPVAIFGPTIFSGHLVAALSSLAVLILTTLIALEIKRITFLNKTLLVLFTSISPWAVFFGRGGYDISLSLAFLVLSVFLFIKSLSNPKLIILSFLIAGLSATSYHTERYLSLILFPVLIWTFKDRFKGCKKYLLIGVLFFTIIQLPSLVLIQSEAFTRRIEQVNYLSNEYFNKNSGDFRLMPFGRVLFISREFITHYLEYFSPRSLFFDNDPQKVRSMPDLSVFYAWMVIPFFFGIKFLLQNRSDPTLKILLLLLIIGPIPAALTVDPFYSTRVLSFLWALTFIISFGSSYFLQFITFRPFKITLIAILTLVSLISLYNSYFVLLKYERGDLYGFAYRQLVDKLTEYPDKKVVIDAGRFVGAHIWVPFYGKIDPIKFQLSTSDKIRNNYYNNTDLDSDTKIDNLKIRPIIWKEDIYEDKIIVGDQIAISNEQIQEHKLSFLFEIKGLDGKIKLIAYITNPQEKCTVDLKNGFTNPKCEVFSSL